MRRLTCTASTGLEELGRTVDEYRRNFVLRYRNDQPLVPGSYPIDRVVAGEVVDEVVVVVAHKDNPDRDWTHRIRSLVITDRTGEPDCLVLIIHDASAEVEAEDRFERAFRANPAPAVICRLSDLRFVKVNEGFLELTGYQREDVLGRSIYEVDVLETRRAPGLALERLRAGETIPQMEACLTVPSDPGGRLVVVAGQPIEIGDEPCMLFTFADLEPRRKAETALRHSEERFAKAFRLAPRPDHHRHRGRPPRWSTSTRRSAQCWATRRRTWSAVRPQDLGLWADEAERQRFRAELSPGGTVRGFEARLRAKDGAEMTCLIVGRTVTLGGRTCILCAFQDITPRGARRRNSSRRSRR